VKKGSWLGLWMLVFAVVGIVWLVKLEALWGLTSTQTEYPRSAGDWFAFVLPLAVMGFIGLVGLSQIPPSPLSEKHQNLARIRKVYSNTFATLVGQRWLWWLFGLIVIANLIAAVGEHGLYVRMGFYRAYHQPSGPFHQALSDRTLVDSLAMASHQALRLPTRILDSFVPHVNLSAGMGGMTLYAVLALVGIAVFGGKIRRLASQPGYERPSKLIGVVGLPLALVPMGIAVYEIRRTFFLVAQRTTSTPTGIFGGKYQMTSLEIINGPLWAIFAAVVGGFLLAGLAGSLKRAKGCEPVSGDSFFADSVRGFIPVAGALLLLESSGLILTELAYVFTFAPLRIFFQTLVYIRQAILPLFVLVPFAGVIYGVGTFRGLWLGVRDWLSHAWDAVVFLSLGYTFVAIVLAVEWAVRYSLTFRTGTWTDVANQAPNMILRVLLAAFTCVAVWEFYQHILSKHAKSASEDQGAMA
jgi:hypothetical protein